MALDKRIFAIYDPDPEFVFRFMEFARKRCALPLEIQAFTAEEHLRRMCEKTQPEILLVSSLVMNDEIRKLEAGTIVVLLEDEAGETEGLPTVYKYQPPEELLRKVTEFCEKPRETAAEGYRKREMELIGIYSPVGRSRKTSFSLTMGQILAGNRTVLYLNLETFAGFEQLFGEQYDRTLSDLLYFARQEDTDLSEKLGGIIRTMQELDYVPPVFCPEDLQSVSPDDWFLLFDRIKEQTCYEILLLDLGESIQGLTAVLNSCKRIYVPVRKDPMSQAKLEQFFWVLEKMHGKEVLGKIRKITVPFCQNNKTGKEFFKGLAESELGNLVRKELAETAQT